MRLTLHEFRRMAEVVAEKWTKLGGGPLVQYYQQAQSRNNEPHPRELSCAWPTWVCLGLLGASSALEAGQWLEMEPLLPSKQPWQRASRTTLEGGGSTNRGSQQIPQRRSVSGPCSSWGTGKKKKMINTAQRSANTGPLTSVT